MSLPKLGARLPFVLDAPPPPPPPPNVRCAVVTPTSFSGPLLTRIRGVITGRGVVGPLPWFFASNNTRLEIKWVTGDGDRENGEARKISLSQLRHSRKETYSPEEMWVFSVDWIPLITRSSSVMRLAVFLREIFLVPRPPFARADTLQFAFCILWSSALSATLRFSARSPVLTSQ